jgi:hypothetical protein
MDFGIKGCQESDDEWCAAFRCHGLESAPPAEEEDDQKGQTAVTITAAAGAAVV